MWSIHPSYLDVKGLVGGWREALLAQKVLQGKTSGYRNHSSLIRFKAQSDPVQAIDDYLWGLYNEACARGYNFDSSRIALPQGGTSIAVTDEQIDYEWIHLMKKLYERDRRRYHSQNTIEEIKPHPIFTIVFGEIEAWEKVR
jgi:hypothetical protein